MSKRTSTCVVTLLARDVEAGISQEPSEPARVLGFAKPNVPVKSEEREKPCSLTNPQSKDSANRGVSHRQDERRSVGGAGYRD